MFDLLEGKIITKIEGAYKYSEEIDIYTDDGKIFRLSHYQDCCESVIVEDVCGDINRLIGQKVIEAREAISSYACPTYTFYIIRTNEETVTIRWCGSSNGYYSEKVDMVILDGKTS